MRSIQVFGNKSYYWLDATNTTSDTDTITLTIYAGYHYLIPDASALMGEADVNTPMSDIDSTTPTTRDVIMNEAIKCLDAIRRWTHSSIKLVKLDASSLVFILIQVMKVAILPGMRKKSRAVYRRNE